MLVQMKFHADLEEVPHEVSRLLEDVITKESAQLAILQRSLGDITGSGAEGMLRQFTELQALVGKSLKISARIEDILGLIQGFHSAVLAAKEQAEQEAKAKAEAEAKAAEEAKKQEESKDDKPLKGNPDIEEFSNS